ncbi:4-hydroxybutyrate CoA-transferase, partial [Operophtera brumata]
MTQVGKSGSLKDIKVVHMHTEKEAPYVAPELKDTFRSDAIPIFLQDIPKLFHRKIICPDLALI